MALNVDVGRRGAIYKQNWLCVRGVTVVGSTLLETELWV